MSNYSSFSQFSELDTRNMLGWDTDFIYYVSILPEWLVTADMVSDIVNSAVIFALTKCEQPE